MPLRILMPIMVVTEVMLLEPYNTSKISDKPQRKPTPIKLLIKNVAQEPGLSEFLELLKSLAARKSKK